MSENANQVFSNSPISGDSPPIPQEEKHQPRRWQTNEKNHNVCRYNVRFRFPLGHICNACAEFEGITDEMRRLLKSIFAIHGIEFANLDGYTVVVGKGEMFDWSEVRPQIERFVNEFLAKRDKVKDGKPTTLTSSD